MICAADCTGHGVPGAMVSVVCNNSLNRAVREFQITDPGKILDKTRELVIQEFEKSEDEVKDGMDVALLSIETDEKVKDKQMISYAGAHNPLWIIRKEGKEVEEIKANKQPIGKFSEMNPFNTHFVEMNVGDRVYIFTDGYPDQFGGDKGKKLKSGNFKKYLLSLQEKSMNQQEKALDEFIENWMGDLEQIDDICVIGIEF